MAITIHPCSPSDKNFEDPHTEPWRRVQWLQVISFEFQSLLARTLRPKTQMRKQEYCHSTRKELAQQTASRVLSQRCVAAATASVLFQQLVGLQHMLRHRCSPGFGQHQPGIFRLLKKMIRHMIKISFYMGFPWFIRSPIARHGAFGGGKYHKTHIIYMYWYSAIGYIIYLTPIIWTSFW